MENTMEKVKVAYIARASVPSTSTNSIHIAKITEAFAQISPEPVLIVSGGDESMSLLECYGIKDGYGIKRFRMPKKDRLHQILWAKKAVKEAGRLGATCIVTRDPFTAFFGVMKGYETVLDLHGDLAHLCGRFYRMIRWKFFAASPKFHPVFISKGLQDYYLKKYGLPREKSVVLPDACNLDDFEEYAIKEPALSGDSLHIGYFGKALVGKGIELIRRLAELDSDDLFDIYGATQQEAEKETGKAFSGNVVFHGRINNKEVPERMCDMDVLILPNQDKLRNEGEDIGKFTSPLKMFEYMASGRVIVASDLEVLREVIDDSFVYLADAGDENSWMKAINEIKKDRQLAKEKAVKAKEEARKYTWRARAGAMLSLTGQNYDR